MPKAVNDISIRAAIAIARVYRISISPGRHAFERRYARLIRESLDLARMNEARAIFIGEHDFAAFRTLGTEVKTTIRRVEVSEWTRDGAHLLYRVEASSFLRHMVRTMVAVMIEVGRGKLQPGIVAELLAASRALDGSCSGSAARPVSDGSTLLNGPARYALFIGAARRQCKMSGPDGRN